MEKEYKGFTVNDDGTVINKFGKSVGYVASPKGYRYVKVNGKQVLKHRFIWEAFNGEIPKGMEIDHIIPISEGGGDELSNLRLVSSSENKRNIRTIEKYKISNKNKDSYLRRMKASMWMWMFNTIKNYHNVKQRGKVNPSLGI